MITIEVDKAIAELKDTLGRLKPAVMNDAISKSLNAAMKKARSEAYEEIRKVYNIRTITDVTSKLKGSPAKPGRLEARLYADRRGIQMAYFQPAQETSGKKRISIEIRKGERKTLKSAFVTTGNKGAGNQITSIFARGQYEGRAFSFRTKRTKKSPAMDTPIALLRTTSPMDMLRDKAVVARINRAADDTLIKNLENRIKRILKKQGTGPE